MEEQIAAALEEAISDRPREMISERSSAKRPRREMRD